MTNDANHDGVTRRLRGDETATECIVDAVANAIEADPLSLPPLYETIDPEALDALFRTEPASPPLDGLVVFVYAGCVVTVHADGEVRAVPEEDNVRVGGVVDRRVNAIDADRSD